MKMPPIRSALLACSLVLAASASQAQQSRLPVVTLTVGMHLVRAELAAKDADRQQGLMYREKMGANEGMVFLFDGPAQVCMWMKNTPLPLSVAFIDEGGAIVNIEDMQPQSTQSHCARKPVRYALEMNQGWFRQKNIKPGTVIGGLPK